MSDYTYTGRSRSGPGIQEIVIEIPQSEWLTSNQRLHYMQKAARTAALRTRATLIARSQLLPVTGPVLVACETYYRTGRGLDADACAPALKACIDGFTDAHIWPDDNGNHLVGILYKRSARHPELRPGWHALRITITNQEVTF